MTTEEAIKILKSKMDGHTDTSYEWAETVRMAIEALEQKPRIVAQVRFDNDMLRELCQRAAEELKEQFVNEGVWQIMGVTLPEVGKDVLICDIDGDIYLTHRVNISSTKFEFYDEWGDRIKNIVAWMPLPAPYQVEE